MKNFRHLTKPLLIIGSYLVVIFLAFLAANYLASNPEAGTYLATIGYPGVFILALVAGINLFPPIPAAAVTPLLTAEGLHIVPIIISLSLGTLLADTVAYIYGARGGDLASKKYPKLVQKLTTITKKRQSLIPILVGLYAGLIPLPNEIIVMPLAALGVRYRHVVAPLLLGDIVSQAILAFGIQHLFDVWM